jgi:hypothetical protein
MPTFFLDSSALVKRYVDEIGTDRVLALVTQPGRLVVSRLAFVEVTAAVSRRRRAGGISSEQCEEILAVLDQDFEDRFEAVDLTSAVITEAVGLV